MTKRARLRVALRCHCVFNILMVNQDPENNPVQTKAMRIVSTGWCFHVAIEWNWMFNSGREVAVRPVCALALTQTGRIGHVTRG